MKRKCQNCMHFDGPDRFVDLYPVEGQCRRNAPQALLLPITNKSKPDDEGSTETPNTWFAADWPIVSGDDWCGEFVLSSDLEQASGDMGQAWRANYAKTGGG